MKIKTYKRWLCLAIIVIFAFFSGCNSVWTGTGELTLNAYSVTLDVGETFALKASTENATFTSENETVAKVDDKGRVFAVAAGTTKIIAAQGKQKAECAFTVKSNARPVTYSLQTNETQKILRVGESFKFAVSILKNGVLTAEQATYVSSNSTVATVFSDGVVTAVEAGETVITASYGEAQASCEVIVSDGAMRIALNESSLTIDCGEQITLQATLYKDGKPVDGKIVFSSNNDNVTVSDDGVITGAFCGESIVTVRNDFATAYCKVRVEREEKISSLTNFLAITDNAYVRYTLTSDIDFAEYEWQRNSIVRRLSSTFNGNGYKLYNIKKETGGSYTAIFGELTETANLKNVAFYVSDYKYKSDCGVLAHTNRGRISNCYIKASCTAMDTTTDTLLQSGIVNENYGIINNLLIDVTVTAKSNQPGRFHALAARNAGVIENCIVVSAGLLTYSTTDESGNKTSHISYQLLSSPDNGYAATTAANTHNGLDKRRKNCLIFENAANLLAFWDGGYAINGSIGYVTNAADALTRETTAFESFVSEIWSFTKTRVSFFGKNLYTA